MTGQTHRHGPAPYRAVVLHGGPGGAGEAAPLAAGLAARGFSALEPQQTALSVAGQVAELHAQITTITPDPITLIGWSWGAWLGLFFAAAHPDRLTKLILVGSGPFAADQAKATRDARNARLTDADRAEIAQLMARNGPGDMTRLTALMDKSDAYAPDDTPPPEVTFSPDIHRAVWTDACTYRDSGALIDIIAQVQCPILALHGEDDPHPAAGVRDPLLAHAPNARFVTLPRCGHKPWAERHAKDAFYKALVEALA